MISVFLRMLVRVRRESPGFQERHEFQLQSVDGAIPNIRPGIPYLPTIPHTLIDPLRVSTPCT